MFNGVENRSNADSRNEDLRSASKALAGKLKIMKKSAIFGSFAQSVSGAVYQ